MYSQMKITLTDLFTLTWKQNLDFLLSAEKNCCQVLQQLSCPNQGTKTSSDFLSNLARF
jgi:hypothetical protein